MTHDHGLSHNYAFMLGRLGRHPEALRHAEQAVAIRRPLAAAFPPAIEPELAQSLSLPSTLLAEEGRGDEHPGSPADVVGPRMIEDFVIFPGPEQNVRFQ